MIMSAYGLLRDNPSPSRDRDTRGTRGNLCRCTGYQNIVQAVATPRQPEKVGADDDQRQDLYPSWSASA